MNLIIIQTIYIISQTGRLLASNANVVTKNDFSTYTFKDYIKKFSPVTVWERIDRRRSANKSKITFNEEIEEIMNGIDPSDELLRLRVVPTNTSEPDFRRYRPLPLKTVKRDPWNYRFRFYELMKQVIFDVRNKMVPTLRVRESHRRSSLYKMGFITAKADRAAKTFAKFAYRAFKLCTYKRHERVRNLGIVKSVMVVERLLNLWFDVDLLADVIERNDINCKQVLEKYTSGRKQHWKWVN